MATIKLTLQDVNFAGNNINIVTQATTDVIFNETAGANSLSTVMATDSVTIGSFTYTYEYLGSGNVRGDADQLAAFIRIISSPSGAPLSEGTAFAIDLSGEPGDADYPNLQNGNTQLALADLDKSTPTQIPGVPCFVAGTRIKTSRGEVLIENLAVGDLILTMDCGYQPIRWIGGRKLSKTELDANPKLTPIRICAGALGNNIPAVDLLVSPQHRMLVRSKIAGRMFDNIEVLIPANKLIDCGGINIESEAQGVAYFHMLFERHQIVFANGAPTESLFTGPEALKAISPEARLEIETLFPEITTPNFIPISARPIPEKGKQMRELARRHEKNKKPLLMNIA